MALNKATAIGNLGANPEIRAPPSGQNVANFSLATTERFTEIAGGGGTCLAENARNLPESGGFRVF